MVGVLSVHKQTVLNNDTEPLTIVDLDSSSKRGDKLQGGVDVSRLPQGPAKHLQQQLTKLTKSRGSRKSLDNKHVAIAFVQFMVDLFSDYKTFIKPGTIELNIDKFIDTRNETDQHFFRDLSSSQSFLLWSYEAGAHMNAEKEGDHELNLFELLCSAASN